MNKARTNQLSNSIEDMLKNALEWANATDSYMTKAFEDAVNTLVVTFESEAVPPTMQPFVEIVNTLSIEWDAWAKAVSHTINPNEMPTQRFWDALKSLAELHGSTFFRRTAKPLLSIEQLESQGVNTEQMCRYYGFVDDKGVQMYKISEEKKKPGTHLNDSYVSPQQRLFDEEYEKHVIAQKHLIEKLEQKTVSRSEPNPQAVEELLDQSVSLHQIMLICHMTEEEVRGECERLGRDAPAMHYDTKSSHFDPEVSEIQQRIYDSLGNSGADAYYEETTGEEAEETVDASDQDESQPDVLVVMDPEGNPLSMESQIILLHQAGMADGDIASELGTEQYPVSHQRVNGVLRRWKRDPSQFSVPSLQ